MTTPKKEPKKPKGPAGSRVLPVDVKTYFKNGKRVKGYSRRKAGEASPEEEKKRKLGR